MAALYVRSFIWRAFLVAALALVVLPVPARAGAADSKAATAEKQHKLIGVLQSNAAPGDKAIACKELTIYGSADAVPALAPLLADPELASWARIALEAIPGSAPDAALRKAMGRLQGRLLVGTINSIGVRKDAKAVSGLGKKLADQDREVAAAAAIALGRIGGKAATQLLAQALAHGSASAVAAVADGCILCAEGFFAQGHPAEAIRLYDTVRQAAVPKQKVLDATRGAILARQLGGIPLLLAQLHSPDKAFFGLGLRTARELPGLRVTDALVTEMAGCTPERQPLLLLAIADRDDAASSAAVLNAAKAGPAPVRIVAINALERQGNALCLPVLLAVAATADAGVAQAALAALTRFPGSAVDAEVLARLPLFTGQARQVLIELAGSRHIAQALPAILDFTEDPDAGVRSAAIHVIGVLGDDQQAAALVELMQHARGPKDRADLEAALVALSSRAGTRCVPHLLPLAQSADATLRIAALHVLASEGGPQALSAVTAAIDDGDQSVRDEAVRTLSTWPNNWPDDSGVAEPMLRLVRYSMKPSYQVLAMRGYLQYIQSDKHLNNEARIEKVRDLLPLLKRPEEQLLAIGVISAVPTAGSLELLAAMAGEPATGDDACAAILKLAGDKASPIPKEQRRQAAQTVAEKASLNATRRQAQQVLKNL